MRIISVLAIVCVPAGGGDEGADAGSETFGRCAIVAESHAICSNLDFWRFARGGGGRGGEKKKKKKKKGFFR